jgi:hypothetical protein
VDAPGYGAGCSDLVTNPMDTGARTGLFGGEEKAGDQEANSLPTSERQDA